MWCPLLNEYVTERRKSNDTWVECGKVGLDQRRERQRALEAALKRIDEFEAQQVQLEALISDPKFYEGESAKVNETLKEVAAVADALAQAYADWEVLEG